MFQTEVSQEIKTRVSFPITLTENRAVCEAMWINAVV